MMGLLAVGVLWWGALVIGMQIGKGIRQARGDERSRGDKGTVKEKSSGQPPRLNGLFLPDISKKPWHLPDQYTERQRLLDDWKAPERTTFRIAPHYTDLLPDNLELGRSSSPQGINSNLFDLATGFQLGDPGRPVGVHSFLPTSGKKAGRRTIVAKLKPCKSNDGNPTWRWE